LGFIPAAIYLKPDRKAKKPTCLVLVVLFVCLRIFWVQLYQSKRTLVKLICNQHYSLTTFLTSPLSDFIKKIFGKDEISMVLVLLMIFISDKVLPSTSINFKTSGLLDWIVI
jgi:hypothetical protein